MKRNHFLLLLGVFFLLLMALTVFSQQSPALLSSVMAFPMQPVAAGLRALSLTGALGNGAALALAVGLSLLPLLTLRQKGSTPAERLTICALSAVLFAALWLMAAPARLMALFAPLPPAQFLPIARSVLGGAVWAFAVLWLVLRLVRLFRTGTTPQLMSYLRAALVALCLLFTAAIALSCGGALVSGLSAAQRGMDTTMALLRFAASALPYGLDIAITLSAFTLLAQFTSGDAAEITRAASLLSRRCCMALGLTAAATALLNLLQILFARFLSDVSVQVQLPIVSLAFLLLILLLARLVVENRRLQDDNDLFI